MMRLAALTLVPLLALTVLASADAPAAPPKADPACLGEMRVQTLPAFSYVFNSEKTTLEKIGPSVQKLLPPLNALQDAGKIQFAGPPVFIYHDVARMADMTQPFTLDVGFPVRENAALPPGCKTRRVPPFHCATLLCSGPLANLPAGYEKLMAAMKEKKLEPSGEAREVYLAFESPDSENNVVQIQIEIAAEKNPVPGVH